MVESLKENTLNKQKLRMNVEKWKLRLIVIQRFCSLTYIRYRNLVNWRMVDTINEVDTVVLWKFVQVSERKYLMKVDTIRKPSLKEFYTVHDFSSSCKTMFVFSWANSFQVNLLCFSISPVKPSIIESSPKISVSWYSARLARSPGIAVVRWFQRSTHQTPSASRVHCGNPVFCQVKVVWDELNHPIWNIWVKWGNLIQIYNSYSRRERKKTVENTTKHMVIQDACDRSWISQFSSSSYLFRISFEAHFPRNPTPTYKTHGFLGPGSTASSGCNSGKKLL